MMLSGSRVVRLSGCRVVGLSGCRVIGLSGYRVIGLSGYRVIGLSGCPFDGNFYFELNDESNPTSMNYFDFIGSDPPAPLNGG
jgi:hypothetical protein